MKLVLLMFAVALVGSTWAKTDQVYCYYTSWAIYRSEPAKYQPSDVDPSLCTIISYAFIGLWANGSMRMLDTYADIDLGQMAAVTALKENNTNLKVLVSMGGWNEGSVNYSTVAANATLRSIMVESVVDFVQTYGFDGFDLDWEYPTRRGGNNSDKENLSTLLKELKEGLTAANSSYLLTAAVLGVGKENISEIYEPENMTKYCDYLNLMLYDFRTPSGTNYTFQAAAVNASTLSSDNNEDFNKELSVIAGIEAWISLGANASRLTLGVPFYGHSWTLANSSETGLFAEATGAGTAGALTASAGTLSYQEICLYNTNYTVVRDSEVVSPYQYLDDQWISYDDPTSVAVKARIAIEYGLAGVMLWDLDFDDFNNACGNGSYPLLNAVNAVINGTCS